MDSGWKDVCPEHTVFGVGQIQVWTCIGDSGTTYLVFDLHEHDTGELIHVVLPVCVPTMAAIGEAWVFAHEADPHATENAIEMLTLYAEHRDS